MLGEQQKSILIVEDEKSVAETLKNNINFLGYNVAGVTSSGKEAIKLSDVKRPDLVLMDISLESEIDGIDSAKVIGTSTDIPIIFISGLTDEATLERVISSESYGFIVKPYDINELKVAIEFAIFKHRLQVERENLITGLTDAISNVLRNYAQSEILKNSWFY